MSPPIADRERADRPAGDVAASDAGALRDALRTWRITPDLLSVLGIDGRFVRTNPSWERVLGLSAGRLDGAHCTEFVHPDDREATLARLDGLVATGVPVAGYENRYLHVDGGYRWLSWGAVVEDGRIHCIARDVTRDRVREVRLRERNRIWESSKDLFVVIGMDGRYRECNPAWRTELGHEPEALVGTPFDALVHPDMLADVAARFARMATGERVADYEIPTRAASGEYRWYSYTGHVEGDAILVIGRNVDAAKRRTAELEAAEEALRQARKLEMIGRLAGGIAHDFNNLLMGLQSNLELLESRLAGDARGRALVGDALEGTARGASLTQRLLAFGRRQHLATGSVDIGALIEGMRGLLDRTLGARVRTSVNVAPDTPPAAVDGDQLERALLSLALNARDAIPADGELHVEVAPVTLDAPDGLPAGRYVRLGIEDTGSGMNAATLERAAEPFFTTRPVGAGSGLGLSMIHGLVEQSGGRFRLSSEPGVGTVAEILLPVAAAGGAPDIGTGRPSGAREAAAGTPGRAPGSRRILVVDDDELVLRGMVGILSRLGHEVHPAASAALALEVLERVPDVELVITDQLMPGMTGLELATILRRDRPHLPVVLATGYSDLPEGEVGLFDARLSKPFGRARLEAVLDGVRRSEDGDPA